MPARVANIAPCITQVTFKLVHYALLINQLRFGLTFFKVLANFPTDKYGLDCGLELNAKVFQLRLNNVSGVLALEGPFLSFLICKIVQIISIQVVHDLVVFIWNRVNSEKLKSH